MHVEPIKRWDDPIRVLTCLNQCCEQAGQTWEMQMATGVGVMVDRERKQA
jgi:hypothetical protein